MSRFYGSMGSDTGGDVTRRGHHFVRAHVRGREIGAVVEVESDSAGCDVVRVYRTGGSKAPAARDLVAEFGEAWPVEAEPREGGSHG